MAGSRQAKDAPLSFQPGVVSNLADRDATNRYKDSNRVRWHKGLAEKLGGWIRQTLTGANDGVYIGVARALTDWSSLDTQQWIGIGTNCKLYVINNGRLSDITPMRKASTTLNSLSVQMGSPVLTVNDPDHRARTGDHIVITATSPVGGFSVSGIYDIDTIPTPDSFTVIFGQNFNSTETGGGSVTVEYDISCGLETNGELLGYGTWLYGMGTYGTPRPVGTGVPARMRTWSLQNWGEDLLGAPSDGELYWWDKTLGPNSRAVLIVEAPGAIQRMLVNPQNRHVILLGCVGLDGVPDPMRVRWCDQENFKVWIPAITNTAGGKRLDYGSRMVTGIQSRATNYIWSDTMMYSMQYVGPPDIFAITELGTMKIVGPNAAVDIEGVAYSMAFDDFMVYDGTLRPLICEIHTKIFGDENRNIEGKFDRTQAEGVYCSTYAPKNEVTWWYPGTDGDIYYATLNTVLGCWYGGQMRRTAYHDVSEAITGYKTNPYGVNGGYLYKHEVGKDEVEGSTVTPQNWFLETYDINVGGADAVYLINFITPNFDRFTGRMNVLLKKKSKPRQSTYQIRGPYLLGQSTLTLGVRCKASQVAIRYESLGQLGEDWRMGTFWMNATPYGMRMGASRSNQIIAIEGPIESYTAVADVLGGTFDSVEQTPPVLTGELLDIFTSRLTWTAAVFALSTVASYQVWRSISGGSFNLLTTVGSGTLTYDDIGLSAGLEYGYYIVAVAVSSSTLQSNQVDLQATLSYLTTPPYPIEVLENFTATGDIYLGQVGIVDTEQFTASADILSGTFAAVLTGYTALPENFTGDSDVTGGTFDTVLLTYTARPENFTADGDPTGGTFDTILVVYNNWRPDNFTATGDIASGVFTS